MQFVYFLLQIDRMSQFHIHLKSAWTCVCQSSPRGMTKSKPQDIKKTHTVNPSCDASLQTLPLYVEVF